MDFQKLTPKDVYDFFVLNGRTIQSTTTINPLTGRRYPDIYVQAAELFQELVLRGENTFTEPVVDLYIADQLGPTLPPDTRYDRSEIDRATPDELSAYAAGLDLPMNERTKERVLRILDYLEVLYPLTILKLMLILSETVFYYQIQVPSGIEVNPTYTRERLWSHSINELEGYQIEQMEVRTENQGWFLVFRMTLDLDSFNYDESLEELPATPENLDRFLAGFPSYFDHHLVIPPRFMEEVAINLPNGQVTTLKVEYRFSRMEGPDNRLSEYLEVRPVIRS